MSLRIVVVGGGVSGLAAALRVVERAPRATVTVLEANPTPGGWLRTVEEDGFVLELGPDSILTEKPAALALVKTLGLEGRLVGTRSSHRGAYVVSRGALERVPEGFSMMAPTDVRAFLSTDIVGRGAKARAALETVLPARRADAGEESLAGFVRRRFGDELLERLAQPLVAGIYGSDAETLSLDATMPRFPAMERASGSVVRALRAKQKQGAEAASGARYGLFVAFDRGMQVLIDALVARLGTRVRTGRSVRAVAREGDGFRVVCGDGESIAADGVVLACAAPRVGAMLREGGLDPALSDGLEAIPHGSAATVTFAFPAAAVPHPLDAYGFVVPAVERRDVLACTWSSVKWPGRAPEGWALLRVFLGGVHDEDVDGRDEAALVASARRELRALMGITAAPSRTRVMRYPHAMPIYRLGHLARVRAIEARLKALPALGIAGNGLWGVGIPDAIASGERAAERVLEALPSED